ncbi:hypothetical protein SAMN02745225_01300 [Ferrithrix thermotolerans DSM 19514]|uniref:Uncharacterized protein n=1 Tax=Ferrithrix thermotolerans DSM 19514 TaxID=1121881 RepID=A0A1M4VFJ4_9ACTN|nr:hypothetical protein SAMN02745225_01300 [Ferrithrix thermotolerans DSM 19514]
MFLVVALTARVIASHISTKGSGHFTTGQLRSYVAALFVSLTFSVVIYGVSLALTSRITSYPEHTTGEKGKIFHLWGSSLVKGVYFGALATTALYIVLGPLHIAGGVSLATWLFSCGLLIQGIFRATISWISPEGKRGVLGRLTLTLFSLVAAALSGYEIALSRKISAGFLNYAPGGSVVATTAIGLAGIMLLLFGRAPSFNERESEYSCALEESLQDGSLLRFPVEERLILQREALGSPKLSSLLLGGLKKPVRSGVVLAMVGTASLWVRVVGLISLLVLTVSSATVAFQTRQGVFYLVPISISYLAANVLLWPFRNLITREALLLRLAPDVGRWERKVVTISGAVFVGILLLIEGVILLPFMGLYNFAIAASVTVALGFGSVFSVALRTILYSPTYLFITKGRGRDSTDATRFVVRSVFIVLIACTGEIALVQFHTLYGERSFLLETVLSAVTFSLVLPLAASSWIGRREYGLQRTTEESETSR